MWVTHVFVLQATQNFSQSLLMFKCSDIKIMWWRKPTPLCAPALAIRAYWRSFKLSINCTIFKVNSWFHQWKLKVQCVIFMGIYWHKCNMKYTQLCFQRSVFQQQGQDKQPPRLPFHKTNKLVWSDISCRKVYSKEFRFMFNLQKMHTRVGAAMYEEGHFTWLCQGAHCLIICLCSLPFWFYRWSKWAQMWKLFFESQCYKWNM